MRDEADEGTSMRHRLDGAGRILLAVGAFLFFGSLISWGLIRAPDLRASPYEVMALVAGFKACALGCFLLLLTRWPGLNLYLRICAASWLGFYAILLWSSLIEALSSGVRDPFGWQGNPPSIMRPTMVLTIVTGPLNSVIAVFSGLDWWGYGPVKVAWEVQLPLVAPLLAGLFITLYFLRRYPQRTHFATALCALHLLLAAVWCWRGWVW